MDFATLGNFFEGRRTKFYVARLRRFLSEAPLFFIAIVVGIALTFRVAIGWAKAPAAEDPAKDPTVGASASQTATATASAAKTAIPVVTAEPRPAATATVPSTPRKRPRPHR
jgi:hypothetical protein